MVSLRSQIGHRAQRTGLYAESKESNWTNFDPFDAALDKAYFNKYWEKLNRGNSDFIIFSEQTNDKFVMPINEIDIHTAFKNIPKTFLSELKGVVLLSGSSKQAKTSSSKLFCYGSYCFGVIFIFPFPKSEMRSVSKTLPPPHIQREYERAGIKYEFRDNKWHKEFSLSSLHQFYLNDVLMHELGHHVDRGNKKTHNESERYAEWFATEYGFRRKKSAASNEVE